MNYQKVYDDIISNSQSQNRIKLKKSNFDYVYYENHHILPKCLGGSNNKENLVLLTAREHFVCHKLLTYIYKGNRKITCAFHKMTYSNTNRCIKSSRDYTYARELLSLIPISEETCRKISKALKGKQTGKPSPMKGKHHSNESKEKSRQSHLGKKHSEETIRLYREQRRGENNPMFKKGYLIEGKNNPMFEKSVYEIWVKKHGETVANEKSQQRSERLSKSLQGKNKGKKRSTEVIEKNRQSHLGKKQSQASNIKRSITGKGKKHNLKEIECPYCKLVGKGPNMSRWHGNNCKYKS